MREFFARHRAAVRWALALLLLALAVRVLWSDPEPVRRALRIGALPLASMAVLVIVNQWFMSLRLSLAVEQCGGGGVPARVWFRLTSVGQFLNLFVPQLGNIHRAIVLKRDYGVSYLLYATGLFAFVWMDLLMGFALAIPTIAVLDARVTLLGVPGLVWLALVVVGLAATPFVARWAIGHLKLGAGFFGRVQSRMTLLLETAGKAFQHPGFVARFFGVNVLTTVAQVITLYLAFRAVGSDVGIAALVLFQVFVKLSNQITITPGNLGLTELAYGALAHASHETAEQGVAAGMLVRTVGTVATIAMGLLEGGGPLLFGPRRPQAETDA